MEQTVLRRGIRHGTDSGTHGQRHRCSGQVRPAGHRAAGLRVCGAPGSCYWATHGVRGTDTHDHVHAAVHHWSLGQPGVRAASALRLGCPGVPAQVGQYGFVCLWAAGPVVLRAHGLATALRRR